MVKILKNNRGTCNLFHLLPVITSQNNDIFNKILFTTKNMLFLHLKK